MKKFSQSFKTIILADDDADDRDMFAEAISFIDPAIQVEMKRDGEDLMTHLKNESTLVADLIFLDLNMPKKNGKECLIEIRDNHRYHNVPIVIYTTSLNPVDIEETFENGATFFLRKPNSFEELKETLNTLLLSGAQTRTSKADFVIKAVEKV